MRLLFLYGPPAVGKLTVAKLLARRSGYVLFHNQLTVDLAQQIFPWGSAEYVDLVDRLRLEIMQRAAKAEVSGMIFTFVYAHPLDLPFVRKVQRVLRRHDGSTHFYQLTCQREDLFQRVKQDSRRDHEKIRTKKTLQRVLDRYDLHTAIPRTESLLVDTSRLRPAAAAELIWRDARKT
ncbi:MAG TPA: AAA family ATPase [Polyangiaceae bacterium]|nr:AAA family ATPase [Polyangiaceae bacterium]